jgi:oligoribonuclease NrnB/cAMP/cGMP phosphodiesterase (DHH superfamily)
MRVLYCSPQLDGISTAAILTRAAKLKNTDVKLGGIITFENFSEQFNSMTTLNGDLIFILDFLPEPLESVEKQLKAITVRNRIAYWSTHHPHGKSTEDFLKKYAHTIDLAGPVYDAPLPKQKVCSAELAQKRFLPKDKIAIELALMAHDNEFWQRTHPTATKISDLIASGREPKELIDNLSRGIFWTEKQEQQHREYLRKKQEAMADIMKHLVIKNIAGTNFGITLAPTILATSDAGQHLLDNHTGIDVSAIVYRNGRISFRKRNECQLNLAEIAKTFGGGGHSYASGAKLNQSITRETFSNAVFLIDQKIREHILNKSII